MPSIVDINECVGAPCQNGATCIDAVNAYTCSCVAGYAGDDCETGKFTFIHVEGIKLSSISYGICGGIGINDASASHHPLEYALLSHVPRIGRIIAGGAK